jgi:hypothetical protein
MRDDGLRRFYDQAERDRHHALRRIQRRRARSIATWLILPLLLFTGVIASLAVCILVDLR